MVSQAIEIKNLDDIKEFRSDGFVRKRVWQTENLHCNIYTFEPGQQNKLHHHPVSNEVIFCWEGQGAVVVGDQHIPIKPRDTILVPVATPHGYINTSDKERLIIVVLQCPLPVEHVADEPGDIAQLISSLPQSPGG